jgi:hypothetical protein
LRIGCFFNVAATAFNANVVSVSRAPFASYAFAYFFRNSLTAVMSASSNCVTRGTLVHDSLRRRAIVDRNDESGLRDTGPHFEKSMLSAAGLDAAGAPGAQRIGVDDPSDEVQRMDALLDNEVARERQDVIPTAELLLGRRRRLAASAA